MTTKKTLQQIKADILNMDHPPQVLLNGDPGYDDSRQPFNLRFNVFPGIIAFCHSTEQAQHVVKVALANREHYKLRVRSGGHDHEAECTDDDAIVIDFSQTYGYDLDENGVLRVESGTIFKQAIPHLNEHNVSIPHGTCETVGVMGFTLGGGWGPWTRKHGMCCEHVVGATLIDAVGEVKNLSIHKEEDKELLWALCGGGGFTFGILSEIFIQTFKQPKHTVRFTATWERLLGGRPIPPAIQVLEQWEKVIAPGENPNLLGTNLQIFAIPEDDRTIEDSEHTMKFYGYYGTDADNIMEALASDMNQWFPGSLKPVGTTIISEKGISYDFGPFENGVEVIEAPTDKYLNFGSWERESHEAPKPKAERTLEDEMDGYFPPDIDNKAPHKLSSKMVAKEGLGLEGRKNLIRTLRSNHIKGITQTAHVHTYVTLGAICGNYYGPDFQKPTFPAGVSFPFQQRPYTIQYQVWWNEDEADRQHYDPERVEQAMQWIAQARDFDFPQTSGSFISFKDAQIPIQEYFMENYDKLREIKHQVDPTGFFGSATTIK